MHRLLANTPPHLFCDHINHNGLDNRKQNLRNCTKAQNNRNKRPHRNSTSEYKGVHWNKDHKKWTARIYAHGKAIHLGHFNDEKEAARAYDTAAKKYHRDFANLNLKSEI